jgi:hypothetical protein
MTENGMDEYNTRIRSILDEVYPNELDEDTVLKVIEYCRQEDMLDPDKPVNRFTFQNEMEVDGNENRWTIFDMIIPHLYGILADDLER